MKCMEFGGVAGAHDGLAGLDLDPLAVTHQRRGVVLIAEDLREPVAQAGLFLLAVPDAGR